MQRLAALVPRPRWHLIRLHGVLAPNAKLGAKVVPHPPAEPVQKVQAQEDNEAKHGRPMLLGSAKLLKRVFNRFHHGGQSGLVFGATRRKSHTTITHQCRGHTMPTHWRTAHRLSHRPSYRRA
jgi:hypothetical protein